MVDVVEVNTEDTGAVKPEVNEKQSAQSKPEGLPEKFNTVGDLAKSYQELEKKLGEQSQSKEAEPILKEEVKANPNNLDIAEQAVETAGLDMTSLQKEYSEKGELNAKSYAALEKAGITKDYVNNYIAGQEALATNSANEIKASVGGDAPYQAMTDWASNNMNEGEKKAYNTAVNSGDMDTVKLAVSALKGQYERANGVEPTLVAGKAQASQGEGYQSWAQVTAAMSDPRYAKDSAYQAEVKAKLANSKI
jgi:hypothetical protein